MPSSLDGILRTSRTPVGLAVKELAVNARDSSLCRGSLEPYTVYECELSTPTQVRHVSYIFDHMQPLRPSPCRANCKCIFLSIRPPRSSLALSNGSPRKVNKGTTSSSSLRGAIAHKVCKALSSNLEGELMQKPLLWRCVCESQLCHTFDEFVD